MGEPVPLLPPVAAALVELEEALHPKMSKIPKNALTSPRLSNKGEGLSVTALPLESLDFQYSSLSEAAPRVGVKSVCEKSTNFERRNLTHVQTRMARGDVTRGPQGESASARLLFAVF